jgi:hypothetical protein
MSKFHRQHWVSRIDPAATRVSRFDRICAPYACGVPKTPFTLVDQSPPAGLRPIHRALCLLQVRTMRADPTAPRLLTHRTLLREVWGAAYQEESHYLHVYISQLRRKIEPDPARPSYILTEPGAGYRLVEPSERPGRPARRFAGRSR